VLRRDGLSCASRFVVDAFKPASASKYDCSAAMGIVIGGVASATAAERILVESTNSYAIFKSIMHQSSPGYNYPLRRSSPDRHSPPIVVDELLDGLNEWRNV
jgi:hypothetical protein